MIHIMSDGLGAKIARIILGSFLLLALLGMVLTDVGGFFRNGFNRTDIAKVGRVELTINQFDSIYRRQLQTAGITPDQGRQMGLPQMILQQELTRQVMLQAAQRVGITVGDQYVADHLQNQLRFIPMPGTPKDKLNAVLRNMNLSEQEFVTAIKGDTSANVLASTIPSQIKAVPETMLNAVAATATQTRQAEIITISDSSLPAVKAATDKELQDYLAANKDRYMVAEQREITIGMLKQDKLVEGVTVTEDDAKAYYEANKDQFDESDKGQKEFKDVKKAVMDLLQQEQADKTLNGLAEEIESQAADGTPVTKIIEPYHGLSFVVNDLRTTNAAEKIKALNLPEDILNNIGEAAFGLAEGETSPIIESKDGAYLLVQVNKVVAPHVPEFAGIKEIVAADWTREQINAQLDKVVDDVIAGYDAKTPNVQALAEKNKLSYRKTSFVAPTSKDIPAAVAKVLFSLSPQNDLTSVKTDDGAMIVRLAAIKTAPVGTLKVTDKEAEDVRTTLAQELQQQFVMGWREYLGVDVNQDLLTQAYLTDKKER